LVGKKFWYENNYLITAYGLYEDGTCMALTMASDHFV